MLSHSRADRVPFLCCRCVRMRQVIARRWSRSVCRLSHASSARKSHAYQDQNKARIQVRESRHSAVQSQVVSVLISHAHPALSPLCVCARAFFQTRSDPVGAFASVESGGALVARPISTADPRETSESRGSIHVREASHNRFTDPLAYLLRIASRSHSRTLASSGRFSARQHCSTPAR